MRFASTIACIAILAGASIHAADGFSLAGRGMQIQLDNDPAPKPAKHRLKFTKTDLACSLFEGVRIPYTSAGDEEKATFTATLTQPGGELTISGTIEVREDQDTVTGTIAKRPKEGAAQTIGFRTYGGDAAAGGDDGIVGRSYAIAMVGGKDTASHPVKFVGNRIQIPSMGVDLPCTVTVADDVYLFTAVQEDGNGNRFEIKGRVAEGVINGSITRQRKGAEAEVVNFRQAPTGKK